MISDEELAAFNKVRAERDARDRTIAELGASNAQLIEERDRLRERTYELERWRRLVSDLDRCPHGRHEGDTCAGWRGPGLFDGGCRDGISLGNPLLGGMAVLGAGLDGAQLIRVPEERADRVNAERWYTPAEPGEMLHHHVAGYVGEEEAAKVGLVAPRFDPDTHTVQQAERKVLDAANEWRRFMVVTATTFIHENDLIAAVDALDAVSVEASDETQLTATDAGRFVSRSRFHPGTLPPAIDGCICLTTATPHGQGWDYELNADADCPVHGEAAAPASGGTAHDGEETSHGPH